MKRKNIWLMLLVLVLLFVWGNSMLSSESSNAVSDAVLEYIKRSLALSTSSDPLNGMWITNRLIRKCAHMLEYSLLGLISLLLFDKKPLALATFGMGVAFVDETIQLYTGRTSLITDIWIDLAGFCFGVCVMWAIITAIGKSREKQSFEQRRE